MAEGDQHQTRDRVSSRVPGRPYGLQRTSEHGPAAATLAARRGPGNQAVLAALGVSGGQERDRAGDEEAADRLADQALGSAGASGAAASAAGASAAAATGGSQGAPPRGRSGAGDLVDGMTLAAMFAPVFGSIARDVRVRQDGESAQIARTIGARGYALGREIGFASGAYQPDTFEGRRLIAHELAHVALGHEGLRARIDMEYTYKDDIRQEAAARRYREWAGLVESAFTSDLANQTHDAGDEGARMESALTAQRAAVLDGVARGWLPAAMRTQGYAGPTIAEIKQAWAEALIAADLIRMTERGPETAADTRVAALATIPHYYDVLLGYARAAEEAHRQHVDAENARRQADYEARAAEWDHVRELDKLSQGPIGEPGERAARGTLAFMRGERPTAPDPLTAPPEVSGLIQAASARALAAEAASDWSAVAADVDVVGNGFAKLLAATLDRTDEARAGLEYVEGLQGRIRTFEEQHAVSIRIPGVFYPRDRTLTRPGGAGREPEIAPETIPWQFYLTNTGVPTRDQPARHGGQWVLTDITSGQKFENREAASDVDSMKFQQGALVDPPLSLFSHLNSVIRFPAGRVYFLLPSGGSYVVETDGEEGLSSFLGRVAVVLTGIALVAGAIATFGATAPATVAFFGSVATYATIGAAVSGIGSEVAGLKELATQGILTKERENQALIAIGLDVIAAMTAGFAKLVGTPELLARAGITGERLIMLRGVSRGFAAANAVGNVYQGWALFDGTRLALRAIAEDKSLDDTTRNRLSGQVMGRALLTGALIGIAFRDDLRSFAPGKRLPVSDVEPNGTIVLAPHAEVPPHTAAGTAHESAPLEGTAHETAPHAETHGGTAHAASHAEVVDPVHASAGHAGSELALGARAHEVGVAGSDRSRDIYFCSARCAPLADHLEAVLDVLPHNHPERAIFEDLLRQARAARRRLRNGELVGQDADALQARLSEQLARNGEQSELFSALMNTDPARLRMERRVIRRQLERDLDVSTTHAEAQAERQAGARHPGGGGDPHEAPSRTSPLETDLLGGIDIQAADRAGRRLQPLRFDTGTFAHTYAEALVPGLPRGLEAEVSVVLPDGTAGRADRVRLIPDADGDIVGAHVYEIKPNTPENVLRGQAQVRGYVEGLKTHYEAILSAKGKPLPGEQGGAPAFTGEVVTYDFERMMAVLRAIRGRRRDAAQMAELEAIVHEVFGGAGAPGGDAQAPTTAARVSGTPVAAASVTPTTQFGPPAPGHVPGQGSAVQGQVGIVVAGIPIRPELAVVAPWVGRGVRNANALGFARRVLFPDLRRRLPNLFKPGPRNPVVTPELVAAYPEFAPYLEERLIEHHLGQGDLTYPFPESVHRQSSSELHMRTSIEGRP